jgi:DegV family protein with EDD domain
VANVRVITDSACDLPDEIARELGIDIVSLSIRFGADEFVDRVELSPSMFWERCASSEQLPETAAPSPGAFQVAYERALNDGCDGVIVIALTSVLSATFQSATVAANAMEGRLPIRIVDTRAVSMAEGLIAIEIAELAKRGVSLDELEARAIVLRDHVHVAATIDTLEHLIKGGRIGGAKAFLGQVLAIKPLLELKDGVVAEAGRARTRSKALATLAEKAKSAAPLRRLAVMDGASPDRDKLVALLSDVTPTFPLVTADIGPTVGTHGGPGIIGLAWIEEC